MKKLILFGISIVLIFCVSCAGKIGSNYIWKPIAIESKMELKGALILNNEFKNYIYKRKVLFGSSYNFAYGDILSKNLPRAFSNVFSEIKVCSNLTDVKSHDIDIVIKPKIQEIYTKISGTGMPSPTKICMEFELLDSNGRTLDKIQVMGTSLGKMPAGKILMSYLLPIAIMPLAFEQFEKSQNEAIDDLFNKLIQEFCTPQTVLR